MGLAPCRDGYLGDAVNSRRTPFSIPRCWVLLGAFSYFRQLEAFIRVLVLEWRMRSLGSLGTNFFLCDRIFYQYKDI